MNKYFSTLILAASFSSLSFLNIAKPASANKTIRFDLDSLESLNIDNLIEQKANNETSLSAIANESLIPVVSNEKIATQPKAKLSGNTISAKTVAIVKEFEGFRSYAYLDTNGVPVIGYGQSRIGGRRVRMGDRISTSAADAALRAELKVIQREILSVVKVELNEHQLGAIASLAFNTGVHSIKRSTLVRKLNQGDYNGAANEFIRWDKADVGGKLVRLKGLTRRRHSERQLFLTPVK